MADALEQLQELGFTEYEARAYHALLQYHPVSGYELAKVSGIPRANIYVVLQKLEERGAVIRAEDGDSTRYLPVAPDELLDIGGIAADEARHGRVVFSACLDERVECPANGGCVHG